MTTTTKLTVADIDGYRDNDEWLGYGYLGMIDMHEDGTKRSRTEIARSHRLVLAEANRLGWTAEQLGEWMNSKHGRWMAEATLGYTHGKRYTAAQAFEASRPNLMTLDFS